MIRFGNEFDKNFNSTFRLAKVATVIGGIASLCLTGVGIWAVYRLVVWVTG